MGVQGFSPAVWTTLALKAGVFPTSRSHIVAALIADAVDRDGRWCFMSQSTLVERAGTLLSLSTAKRALDDLLAANIVRKLPREQVHGFFAADLAAGNMRADNLPDVLELLVPASAYTDAALERINEARALLGEEPLTPQNRPDLPTAGRSGLSRPVRAIPRDRSERPTDPYPSDPRPHDPSPDPVRGRVTTGSVVPRPRSAPDARGPGSGSPGAEAGNALPVPPRTPVEVTGPGRRVPEPVPGTTRPTPTRAFQTEAPIPARRPGAGAHASAGTSGAAGHATANMPGIAAHTPARVPEAGERIPARTSGTTVPTPAGLSPAETHTPRRTPPAWALDLLRLIPDAALRHPARDRAVLAGRLSDLHAEGVGEAELRDALAGWQDTARPFAALRARLASPDTVRAWNARALLRELPSPSPPPDAFSRRPVFPVDGQGRATGTCPVHPSVRNVPGGTCSLCGGPCRSEPGEVPHPPSAGGDALPSWLGPPGVDAGFAVPKCDDERCNPDRESPRYRTVPRLTPDGRDVIAVPCPVCGRRAGGGSPVAA
ncbi:hypothetical protein SUDANB121_00939 [Nocardiopsis dassonvillei]|uniref:hypothetical protein n=1 Tax=Nocardiopsis dassonvillei TaxID=2014 RepID=UPI003F571C23